MTLLRRFNRFARARGFPGGSFRGWERLGTILGVWTCFGGLLTPLGAQPATAVAPASVLTNALQLQQAADADQWASYSVNLDAVVLWTSPARNQWLLHDASGNALVEVSLRDRPSGLMGQRVHLEGRGLLGQGKLQEALVDNDGVHGAVEQSASISLAAGRHPIRLEWFNGTAGFALNVDYRGPGLRRQSIPARALFRPAPSPEELLPGLDYRCYEGVWGRLPDFAQLQPVKSGTAPGFDLAVRTRDSQVGLQWSGYLEVPRAGLYTFWLRSDDGSRLFLGETGLRLQKLGAGALPPPAAQAIVPGQVLRPEQQNQWSVVEGTVSFVSAQAGELQLEVRSSAGCLRVEVAEPAERSARWLRESRIRATGVCCATYALDGQQVAGRLLVPGWRQLELLEVAGARWQECPLVPIGQLSAASRATNRAEFLDQPVRICGQVRSRDPFLVADESGQALVHSAEPPPVGSRVEVLGQRSRTGTNLLLRGVYRRLAGGGTEAGNELPRLVTAEQVKRLDRSEAARNYPVKLRGVIIGLGPFGGFALQDVTRAVHVLWRPSLLGQRPRVGEFWEIEGKTVPGFAPQVRVDRAVCLGSGVLPEPLRPTWDQLSNGSLEMQYVEVQGIVTAMAPEGVGFLTRSGKVTIQFPGVAPEVLSQYHNALVRVRGCLSPGYEPESQQTKVAQVRLWSASFEVDQPAPADPFAVPLKHASELLLFDPEAAALQRVRLAGQVLHHRNGEVFLADQGSGLRFVPCTNLAFKAGDLAEVVGFVDLSGPAPVLREAVARRTGQAELPPAQPLSPTNVLNGRFDATLVRLLGRLESVSRNRWEQALTLQAGTHEFVARLRFGPGLLPHIAPGSVLELTGVYAGLGGNRRLGREIDSFELLLNSPDDIRVLESPSWWTVRHTLMVVGAMLCILLGALGWIVVLRRQVEERSLQLAAEVRRHEQLERQRALEADRARIARDLHDDLGASLTEIGLLAQAGAGALPTLEKAGQRFHAIRNKATEMVNGLDVIVWLINPRKDTLPSLATYLASYAEEYLSASNIACHLKIPLELPALPLRAELRQGLFFALKEALHNVVRHSRARTVEVHLALEGPWLQIAVADDGCGFEPAAPAAGNGLANFRERLARLGGRCEIRSRPGQGTVVSLRLPVGQRVRPRAQSQEHPL